jgi:hypothetical protein
MRAIKACLVMACLLAIAALAAAAAFAENPQFLKLGGGTPTFPIKTTSKTAVGEKPILETAIGKLTCESDATTTPSEITSLTLGVSGIEFKGCGLSTNKEKCTTGTDTAGVILLPSTSFHLVAYKTGTELLAGLLLLAINLEFACGAVKTKLIGNLIALLGPLNVDATNFTLLFDHTGSIQKPTSCEVPIAVCLPGGKTALYSLLANLGLGSEHAVILVKQSITTATDLLIDA